MEIVVDKEVLKKLVQQVSTAIPSRTTLPILNNILFEIKEGKLHLYASNMDFSIKGFIPVDSVENVSFTVPGKALLRILSTLDVPVVKIVYSDRMSFIKWDGTEYKFMSLPPEEFPKMKEFADQKGVKVKTSAIVEGYDLVGFCTAKDDPRPFLNGILLEVRDGELRMVASDAHKLGLYIKRIEHFEEKMEAILSKEVFDFLTNAEEPDVSLAQDKGVFSFSFVRSKLVTRLIEGPYAPYREVIPKEEGFVFKTSVKEIDGVLRRIQEVVSQSNFVIEWVFDGGVSYIKGASESGEAKEKLSGEYKGEALRIGFNVKYLHEIVRHIDDEEVIFHFYGPKLACMIKPAGLKKHDYDLLYLLMPVSLE
ncbi:MAG: DNA polymerase III subunit beta [candidate division WOR-3 bacterium]